MHFRYCMGLRFEEMIFLLQGVGPGACDVSVKSFTQFGV